MRAMWVLVLVACSSSTRPQPQPKPQTVDEQLSTEMAGIHGSDAQPAPDAAPVPVREPPPEPTACPDALADAKGVCVAGKINRECPYPPSTVCSCQHDAPPCSPINHDNDPTVWVCKGPPPPPVKVPPRTDGCPEGIPKGACGKPGKDCSYKMGCCWEHFSCTNGSWAYTYSACPK